MKTKIRRFALLVPLLAAALFLLVREHHLLWKVQELNLFLNTPQFFTQQLIVPGGLLTYLGTFFTQFFFRPWLGVLILFGWWCLLVWLTRRACRLSRRWSVLLLIPVALLLLSNVTLGYWIYVLKFRGIFFAPLIGTCAAMALLWAYRSLPRAWWWRAAFMVVAVVVGYPMVGIYALASVLLMALGGFAWREKVPGAVLLALLAVVCVTGVPLVFYRLVYIQTNIINIYWAGLPVFALMEVYYAYYIPYYLLAAFYVLMMFSDRLPEPKPAPLPNRKAKKSVKEPRRLQWLAPAVNVLAVIVLAAVVWTFWYKDENYRHELAMQHFVERQDWPGVLEEAAAQVDEPTRAIVMMRNLALSRLGRQGDDMYNYLPGSKQSNAPFPVTMSIVVGRLIYYHYGLLNECHRLCMEEGVEFGWRAEHLQYMARCAMISGENVAARKYLDLLDKTLYYGKWVKAVEPLMGRPDLMEQTAEMGPVVHMQHYDNRVGTDNNYVEKFLLQLLAQLDADDPYFQEQALLAALWSKNASLFWPRFTHYVELHPQGAIPRLYQEAAYLFGNLEHRSNLDQVPFRQDVKDNYAAFMNALQQCEDMPIEEVRGRLYPQFGNTYYFDYYLVRGLTLL